MLSTFIESILFIECSARISMVFLQEPEQYKPEDRSPRRSQSSARHQHILRNRLPFGEQFPEHVPALIAELARLFSIPSEDLDLSYESVHRLGEEIERRGRVQCANAPVFACIVAYLGEVQRHEVGGQWKMVRAAHDHTIWEPWIVDPHGRSCNPWADTYRVLMDNPLTLTSATYLPVSLRRVRRSASKDASQRNDFADFDASDLTAAAD